MKLDEKYIRILTEELVTATGCTEPIAIAFAAAKAKELLDEPVKHVDIACSSNIIKNVKCVTVPNTGGLIGIEVAALIGIIAGKSEKMMEVIDTVSDGQRKTLLDLLSKNICTVTHLDTPITLHIIVNVYGETNNVCVEVTHTHTHIQSIKKNGIEITHDELMQQDRMDRSILNVADIVAFANRIDLAMVKPLIENQIVCNSAIAKAGVQGGYGVHISEILMEQSNSLSTKMAAYAAAASEARMSGCPLPVVTNSGSGNQGITVSVPLIVYAKEKQLDNDQLIRGLLVSNLLCVHLKTGIGHLSAFCGVVAASSACAGALTYLENGNVKQIGDAIKNTLASVAGMCCDGAKATCGFKIATCIKTAYTASLMALKQRSYQGNVGILKEDIEKTINDIGKLARCGMKQTDQVILDIMLDES